MRDEVVRQRQVAGHLVAAPAGDPRPEPELVVDGDGPRHGDRRVRRDRPQRRVGGEVRQPLRLRPRRCTQLVDGVHRRDALAVPRRVEALDVRRQLGTRRRLQRTRRPHRLHRRRQVAGAQIAELRVEAPRHVGQEPRRLEADLRGQLAARRPPADDPELHRRADPDLQEAEQREADPRLDPDDQRVVRRARREDDRHERPAGVVGQPHDALLADPALDADGQGKAVRPALDALEAEPDDHRRLEPEVRRRSGSRATCSGRRAGRSRTSTGRLRRTACRSARRRCPSTRARP